MSESTSDFSRLPHLNALIAFLRNRHTQRPVHRPDILLRIPTPQPCVTHLVHHIRDRNPPSHIAKHNTAAPTTPEAYLTFWDPVPCTTGTGAIEAKSDTEPRSDADDAVRTECLLVEDQIDG